MRNIAGPVALLVKMSAFCAGLLLMAVPGPVRAQNAGNPTILEELRSLRKLIEGIDICPDVRRQFYLTRDVVAANQVSTACASGYHFASLWEIIDTSNLKYNTALGATSADAGQGPPTDVPFGWGRTGGGPVRSGPPGRTNCFAWTSVNSLDFGTAILPPQNWVTDVNRIKPWETVSLQCSGSQPVWCIQD